MFGGDVFAVAPGEIRVVRSPARETTDPNGHEVVRTTPVCLLVSAGRGMVSTSRFLLRIVAAWCEDFAAPDYLLQREFLADLAAEVSRRMDAQVCVRCFRIFVPCAEPRGGASPARLVEVDSTTSGFLRQVSAAVMEGTGNLLSCALSDRQAARALLGAECREYGRLALFTAER